VSRYVTLSPLAALNATKSRKNIKTKKAMDEALIWPADSLVVQNSPETENRWSKVLNMDR